MFRMGWWGLPGITPAGAGPLQDLDLPSAPGGCLAGAHEIPGKPGHSPETAAGPSAAGKQEPPRLAADLRRVQGILSFGSTEAGGLVQIGHGQVGFALCGAGLSSNAEGGGVIWVQADRLGAIGDGQI